MSEFFEKYLAYKTLLLNGTVMGIVMVDVESFLKVVLLIVTIGYTVWKWISNYKKK